MKKIILRAGSGTCVILVGEKFSNIQKYCGKSKPTFLIDSDVMRLHAAKFSGFNVIELPSGESAKNLDSIAAIHRRLLESGADRGSFIIGVGGGAACDAAGFVASTFMRGVEFGLVPTTLLAQADASIGGKNGVNLDSYKNIVGTIAQPKFCLMDPNFLSTLPREEISNGLAEIIKHGAIASPKLLVFIEKNIAKLLAGDIACLEKAVYESAKIKVKFVQKDELENGPRAFLNFGHTVGHAIEKLTGMPHGKAISIGMCCEAKMSCSLSGMPQKEMEKLVSVLELAGLPTKIDCDRRALLDAMKKDKKNRNGALRIVLLKRFGKPALKTLSEQQVLEYL